MTLDRNIVYRTRDISLHETGNEKPLDESMYILECKVSDRYPMWLTKILSSQHMYKSSFSKYGTIYKKEENLHPQIHAAIPSYQAGKESSACSVQF